MRLVRLGPIGAERPGVLVDDGHALDVGDHVGDFDRTFFAQGGIDALRPIVAAGAGPVTPLDGMRIGSPVARPGNIFCIGLNYADHAAEAGLALPSEPIFFIKSSNAISGPYDDVRIPRGSLKTDWEVELGVVIGRICRYLESDEEALASVAGYMVCNDVSEREFQLERGTQWTKGKSCETFNPAGPWLVTPDEVPDPANLDLWTDVNGVRRQTGNTGTMVFGVAQIIRYLSQYIVLEPGDVIDTGTPPGVAMGRPDKPYLRPGDVVELGVTGLGRQRQRLVAAP
jgi:2-keto-4-pentenoate hydratase/2-oxohepta-3-ene-1,7-dioic acid hydratase in catechol pathway